MGALIQNPRMSAEPLASIGQRVRLTFFDAAPKIGIVHGRVIAVRRSKRDDTTWCYYTDEWPTTAWHGGEIEP